MTFQVAPGEWRRAKEVFIPGKHYAEQAVRHELPRAADTLMAEVMRAF